jgi:FMN phosphatase YigB (HAD superfamily)
MNIRAVFWDLGGVLVRTEDHTTRENLAIRLGMSRTELENLVFAGDSGNKRWSFFNEISGVVTD